MITSHGYAQFGALKYPASFAHFDWANPNAPQGGTLRLMALGSFDTLNPYTLKGLPPVSSGNFLQYGINEFNEPLMIGTGLYDPSGDEPNSSYGLIAQSVQYAPDRSWVVFNLNPAARFHDGASITSADVLFSYQTLLKNGHPLYRTNLQEVARVDVLGPLKIRFIFKRHGNALLIQRLGELPVLAKHYWQGRDFAATTFEPPLGSGPYRISEVVPGKRLVFEKVADWWGKDLPVNRGKYNFARVEVEFYRDSTVAFEAFKAGEFDIYLDNQAKNWATNYNFPALKEGRILRESIPHKIPVQTQAVFFNTRRANLSERSVRRALCELFDFQWANHALFYDAYQRSESYYPNSEFSARDLPQGQEWLFLAPFRKRLPAELFSQPFHLPQTQGHGIGRGTLRQALNAFSQAGWNLKDGLLVNSQGAPFKLELLLVNPSLERIFQPYIQNLRELGIQARLRTVDRAQYKQRLDNYDFDMALMTLPQTLSPGIEQWAYFHSSQAALKGGKNYAGIRSPVVDTLLDQLLKARTRASQVAAAQALDRVLLWNYYSLPNWYSNQHRLAYQNRFGHLPTPPYSLALRTWWVTAP